MWELLFIVLGIGALLYFMTRRGHGSQGAGHSMHGSHSSDYGGSHNPRQRHQHGSGGATDSKSPKPAKEKHEHSGCCH